jgi:hypothetical protein
VMQFSAQFLGAARRQWNSAHKQLWWQKTAIKKITAVKCILAGA